MYIELRRGPDGVQLVQGAVERGAAVWGQRSGWFSAAYGPFRRFSGGDPSVEALGTSYPNLARHLTVFGEAYALTEAPLWLRELNYRKLESEPEDVARKDRDPSDPRLQDTETSIAELPHRTVWAEMQRQQANIPELKVLFDAAPEALNW